MIDTSMKNVRAITFGLRQFNREHEWVVGNAADLIEALVAERDEARADMQKLFDAMDEYGGSWRHCPSTHCERSQECRSPHECSGTGLGKLMRERNQFRSDLATLRAENERLRSVQD